MIPKDGGNVFSGLANIAYTGPDLQSNNIGDDLIARGLNSATQRAGVDQEVRRGLGRPGRADQAEQAVVLRRGAKECHAAVRRGHLLECGQAAGKHAVRAGPQSARRTATTSTGTTVFASRCRPPKNTRSWSPDRSSTTATACTRCSGRRAGPLVTPEAATEHEYEPDFNLTSTWTYPVTNRMLITVAGGANHITAAEQAW